MCPHCIFKMDKQLLYVTELCSVLCGSLEGRGIWQRMDTCLRMLELCSHHCSPETYHDTVNRLYHNTMQNKKFKKKKCSLAAFQVST